MIFFTLRAGFLLALCVVCLCVTESPTLVDEDIQLQVFRTRGHETVFLRLTVLKKTNDTFHGTVYDREGQHVCAGSLGGAAGSLVCQLDEGRLLAGDNPLRVSIYVSQQDRNLVLQTTAHFFLEDSLRSVTGDGELHGWKWRTTSKRALALLASLGAGGAALEGIRRLQRRRRDPSCFTTYQPRLLHSPAPRLPLPPPPPPLPPGSSMDALAARGPLQRGGGGGDRDLGTRCKGLGLVAGGLLAGGLAYLLKHPANSAPVATSPIPSLTHTKVSPLPQAQCRMPFREPPP